jgi:hypothetical protein
LTPARHSARDHRGPRGLLLIAGIVTALVFSGASLLVNVLVSRVVQEGRLGLALVALVAVGSTVGACVATWSARPLIMRVVSRLANGLSGR